MRAAVIMVAAALTLSACGKREEGEATARASASTATVADFTLATRCSDGQELYRLSSGELAQWNSPEKGDGYWVKVEQSAADYCGSRTAGQPQSEGF